jgi:hypothetical protein
MTIEGTGGQSATEAIHAGVKQYGKRITREAITAWNTASQKRVMEAAGQRSGIDSVRDDRGSLESRKNNALHELAQEFTAPVWDEEDEAWVFACTHAFAGIHEWGAMPHEIEARGSSVLIFEWPDMPDEVRDKFESQWESTSNMLEEPQVAFSKVQHPGVPAIGFMRHGRDRAEQKLRDMGVKVESYSEPSGESDG